MAWLQVHRQGMATGSQTRHVYTFTDTDRAWHRKGMATSSLAQTGHGMATSSEAQTGHGYKFTDTDRAWLKVQ